MGFLSAIGSSILGGGAAAATGLSTFEALSLAGSVISGLGQMAASSQQAAMIERNAQIQQQQAQFNARRERESFARLKGKQRAGFAKGGVELTSGSPLDLLQQTAEDEEMTVQALLHGGEVARQNASLEASAVRTQGFGSAAGTILGGATSIMKTRAQRRL